MEPQAALSPLSAAGDSSPHPPPRRGWHALDPARRDDHAKGQGRYKNGVLRPINSPPHDQVGSRIHREGDPTPLPGLDVERVHDHPRGDRADLGRLFHMDEHSPHTLAAHAEDLSCGPVRIRTGPHEGRVVTATTIQPAVMGEYAHCHRRCPFPTPRCHSVPARGSGVA